MAVGDIASQTSTSAFTFQPASGVQICITAFISSRFGNIRGRGNIETSSNNIMRGNGNGAQESYITYWVQSSNQKFFIDNSSYLYFYPYSGHHVGFTAIQTQ